ncbi:hypothetical protein EVAR_65910_1 [Eumeta japonica]|uniref:Uncharacterized protein n=1 Tax=Eumeta variegata TaxID=151549 RepID=A0A4C1ZW60_EUMVA|nr:hypothetical protein EVAR_65910_1 [Eumeta japonica]
MDTHNSRGVTSALLASWEGIGYLMQEGMMVEGSEECRSRGEWATGTFTQLVKHNSKGVNRLASGDEVKEEEETLLN